MEHTVGLRVLGCMQPGKQRWHKIFLHSEREEGRCVSEVVSADHVQYVRANLDVVRSNKWDGGNDRDHSEPSLQLRAALCAKGDHGYHCMFAIKVLVQHFWTETENPPGQAGLQISSDSWRQCEVGRKITHRRDFCYPITLMISWGWVKSASPAH